MYDSHIVRIVRGTLVGILLSIAFVFLMFTQLGLKGNHVGLTLLYTTVNLPFVVWMMKGFFDEIPHEYEDAAMLDGYPRIQAFFKVTLLNAWPGIAATAVFCIIVAW